MAITVTEFKDSALIVVVVDVVSFVKLVRRLADGRAKNETYVFGVIIVSQNVLPVMRSQRDGIIINIGSLSGWYVTTSSDCCK